ncbi:methyl-accepting chemotaxis protein [Tepidibacillus fermentans]|uniref:Methyl-accepting chemotaxis protein n=1 Tax=Tepidibacillus fermentans TaxID=1281767 RepID=A0A4R3K5I8_9BACI|nr:methyl-accepting chemotaxis protein [Tepidibacillus fermentans]TCS78039.1 methyl-accepting chemotaxis protein [Tepidibacillus fermentans]
MDERGYRFRLTKKFVLGITTLSIVTYGTSAFIILGLKDYFYFLPYHWFVIGTMALGIIWSSIFGYLAARILTKPLTEIEQVARKAAAGDLRTNVKVVRSDDELRALGLAFNQMISNISQVVTEIHHIFELTNTHVTELNQASEQAAISAEQISRTIDDIARGAERQAEATNTTVESINQIHHLSETVNQKADQTKGNAYQMKKVIEESIDVVHSLVEGLSQIANENQESIQFVRKLQQHAEEIGTITGVVGDIAEQTNLLALNASIEAARAGEHGRGFAVVAEEVRKLADESRQAVQTISELIQQMQLEVGNVVNQISHQVELATAQSNKGGDTKIALSNVKEIVNDVVESVEHIGSLISEQAMHIEKTKEKADQVAYIAKQTSSGSQQVAASTQQQTAAMEEIAATTQLLKEQAHQLRESILKFKI